MTRAERIEAGVRALLKDYPRPDCDHVHHAKRDQHDYLDECPVEARLRAAMMELDAALALPPDPVPRRLTVEDVYAAMERSGWSVWEGSRLADALNARILEVPNDPA